MGSDLDKLFTETNVDVSQLLSTLLNIQLENKAMLYCVIEELSNGVYDKQKEMLEKADKIKNEELQILISSFIENRGK